MSEPTKTFLSNLALASGVGLAVGAIVACALVPVLVWWRDRKVAGGGRAQATAAASTAVAPSPGVVLDDEIDWAASVDRLVGGHQP